MKCFVIVVASAVYLSLIILFFVLFPFSDFIGFCLHLQTFCNCFLSSKRNCQKPVAWLIFENFQWALNVPFHCNWRELTESEQKKKVKSRWNIFFYNAKVTIANFVKLRIICSIIHRNLVSSILCSTDLKMQALWTALYFCILLYFNGSMSFVHSVQKATLPLCWADGHLWPQSRESPSCLYLANLRSSSDPSLPWMCNLWCLSILYYEEFQLFFQLLLSCWNSDGLF